MKRIITLVSVVALVMAMSITGASADHNESEDHCPQHSHSPNDPNNNSDTDKIGSDASKTITVLDQDGVAHQLKVTNSGTTVTFELLTDGLELVEVSFCAKGGSTLTNTGEITTGTGQYTHPQGISYTVVYSIVVKEIIPPEEVPEGEWCSPGFWRNSPLQAAAAAALVDWSTVAGADHTNYEHILDNPQIYGGALFNAVGDALSAAAGLQWKAVDGQRPENSCPFSADRSRGGTKFQT